DAGVPLKDLVDLLDALMTDGFEKNRAAIDRVNSTIATRGKQLPVDAKYQKATAPTNLPSPVTGTWLLPNVHFSPQKVDEFLLASKPLQPYMSVNKNVVHGLKLTVMNTVILHADAKSFVEAFTKSELDGLTRYCEEKFKRKPEEVEIQRSMKRVEAS